jgi:phage gp29-like protein
VDELFKTVHNDAMRVGPTVDAIVSWAERATELERRRRERLVSTADGFAAAGAPMRLHLEWRNGAIDTSTSRIAQTVELEQVSPYLGNAPRREKPVVERTVTVVDVDPEEIEEPSTPYDLKGAVR